MASGRAHLLEASLNWAPELQAGNPSPGPCCPLRECPHPRGQASFYGISGREPWQAVPETGATLTRDGLLLLDRTVENSAEKYAETTVTSYTEVWVTVKFENKYLKRWSSYIPFYLNALEILWPFHFWNCWKLSPSEIQIIYTERKDINDAGALTYFNGKVIICTKCMSLLILLGSLTGKTASISVKRPHWNGIFLALACTNCVLFEPERNSNI